MKAITTAVLLLLSTFATADVLEVNIYKPLSGQGPQTYQYAAEAKAIAEKLGGNVSIGSDLDGNMHYALTFASWSEWAGFGKKLDASKEWARFIEKINEKPSAELIQNYLLNVAASGGEGQVYQVFIWEAMPGRVNELIAAGMEAKKLHEKAGATVGIYVDQLNRMHYDMSFASWEAWAKFQDTPDPDFQAWMAEQNKNPTGKLIKVYTASVR